MGTLRQCGWPLYIHGEAGTGKTCIAALLYRDFIGYAAWCSCRALLRDMAAFRADPAHAMVWLMASGNVCHRPAANAWADLTDPGWLVCLDDLGTRELSPTQSEILLDLLDARVGKPLIVTGNHDRAGLLKFMDPRIVSRLCQGTVIGLVGKDRRTPQVELEVVSNG